jgi:hypothetical protein
MCPLCSIRTCNTTSLLNHILDAHHTTAKPRTRRNTFATIPYYHKYGTRKAVTINRYHWRCNMCSKIVSNISEQLTHIQTEHNMFLQKCAQCFKKPKSYTVKEVRKCIYCKKNMMASSLYNHCVKYHLQEIPFCNTCCRYFINENYYQEHFYIQQSSEGKSRPKIRLCYKVTNKN